MSPTFISLSNLFSPIEGRIFLQFIIVLLISASLVTIFSNRKLISQTTFKRAFTSILLILGLQILYFIGLYLISIGTSSLETFLFSSYKFLFSFSVLWIVWLWCFPSKTMNSDGPKFILGTTLTLIFLIQLFFTGIVRIINIEMVTLMNNIWFLITMVVLILGILLLVINHHLNWFWGCIFILIHFIGLLTYQFFPEISQFQSSGNLLFSQIIAYTFLPILSHSFIFIESNEENKAINQLPIASKKMTILPAQNVFQSWLSLALKNQDILIKNEFLKCLVLTFHADQVLLLGSMKQQNGLNLMAGFSNKNSKLVFPFPIGKNGNKYFEGYIKEAKSFYLSSNDYFSNDLKLFLNLINITQPVNILFFPVKLSTKSK